MLKSFLRLLIPGPMLDAYHYILAKIAAYVYRHPSERLIVIGVTGTNGKSTTVQFIGRLLEAMGERVGWTTTASFKVGEREWVNEKKMTMLGRFQTQKLLREMVDAGCRFALIETTSQGITQFRHIGIHYDVLVFTNLTPEHIEAHGGFENYKKAKGALFAKLASLSHKHLHGQVVEKTIVVNLGDPHAEYFLSFKADRYSGCAVNDVGPLLAKLNSTPVVAKDVSIDGHGTTFWLGEFAYHLKPIGRFYFENALLAIACVKQCGLNGEPLRRAVESLEPIPGRLERIDEGQPFVVIVDYAYEPTALAAAYEAVELIPHTRLIHVVGSAGGGRDVARRAVLGKMSARHDAIVIVTNEDPYDEPPERIINQVADAAGAEGKMDGVDLYRILDRQEAIDFAIKIAERDDLVLITGKGSEPVMAVARGKKVPWDDRLAARHALTKRYGNS